MSKEELKPLVSTQPDFTEWKTTPGDKKSSSGAPAFTQRKWSSGVFGALLTVGFAIIFMLLSWISLPQFSQFERVPGVVEPYGTPEIVRMPADGRVLSILVKDGDRVVKGQLLAEIQEENLISGMPLLANQHQLLQSEIARLEAEKEGIAPVFPEGLKDARPDLVALQVQLYEFRKEALQQSQKMADQIVAARQRVLGDYNQTIKDFEDQVDGLNAQQKAVIDVIDNPFTQQLVERERKSQLRRVDKGVKAAQGRLQQAKKDLYAAKTVRQKIDQDWKEDIDKALGEKRQALANLEDSIRNQHAGAAPKTDLLAPMDGNVSKVVVFDAGEAAPAQMPLLRLLPDQNEVLIGFNLPKEKAIHLSKGQKVDVYPTHQAVDFAVKPVPGEIAELVAAPDETAYRVRVRVQKSSLQEDMMRPDQDVWVGFYTDSFNLLTLLKPQIEAVGSFVSSVWGGFHGAVDFVTGRG